MTQKHAREELLRYGKLSCDGFVAWEKVTMRNNWQEYTGTYCIAPKGMESDAIDVKSITAILRIIKKGVEAFPLMYGVSLLSSGHESGA